MGKPSLRDKMEMAGDLFGAGAAASGSGGSSSGGSYLAGEGISISGRVISAEVTQEELDAAKAEEIPVSFIEGLTI